MIIDLLGGTYEQRFKDWNSQRTINWYPKVTSGEEKNKTKMSLTPRLGLTQFTDLSGNTVRALFTARSLGQERCFAVAGNTLYEILYDGSNVSRGTLTGMADRTKVYMTLNNNDELMIQDPLAGYVLDLTDNSLVKITDEDYPKGNTLDYADGYNIISDVNGRVTFSNLGQATSWDGLNFFTPSFKADKVKAVLTFREEIYCFGDETIEIYINDGTTPFIRQARTSLYYGLTARDSVSSWHGGVFFLGKSKTGGSEVYMMGNNYALKPLSTPAISQLLNRATNEDAESYVLSTKDGHIFYHLHLPALKTTLVYDMTTGLWHERQSQRPYSGADGSFDRDMYRGRCHTLFKGIDLFGDWYSGKIFKEEGKLDDGNIRTLERISSVFHNELKFISVYELELDINAGLLDGSVIHLTYSLNGGNTFEPERLIEVGALGEYDNRVIVPKLGTARNWVIKFKVTDPIDVTIMQARVRGAYGSW